MSLPSDPSRMDRELRTHAADILSEECKQTLAEILVSVEQLDAKNGCPTAAEAASCYQQIRQSAQYLSRLLQDATENAET